jgi:signal transduction histidine kinase
MGVLLRELVDLGRAPSDQRMQFSAGEALDDVARLLRHSAREHGVTLTCEPDEVTVCSSRDRVVQILLNLGLNAVDACAEGGSVHISCRADGDRVRFLVSDTGEGLPTDTSALFEPFFTTKPVGKGTGLGLFVVDRLVSSLGGSIWAENRPEGGATFTVDLPDCGCGSNA